MGKLLFEANYKAQNDFDHELFIRKVTSLINENNEALHVSVSEFTEFTEEDMKKSKVKIIGLPVPTHVLKIQMTSDTKEPMDFMVALQYLTMKMGIKKGLGIPHAKRQFHE